MKVSVITLTQDCKLCRKNKDINVHSDIIAYDDNNVYYQYDGQWYDVCPISQIDLLIKSLSANKNYIRDHIVKCINQVRPLSPVLTEIGKAMGIDGINEHAERWEVKVEQSSREYADRLDTKRREAEEKEARELSEATEAFRNGEYISVDIFEKLCKKYGYKMHPRTVSSIRNNVSEVSINSIRLYNRHHRSKGISEAVEELHKLIR